MAPLSRWSSPAVLAALVGAAACMAAPAGAQQAGARVRVDAADVVVRDGQAYWFDDRNDRYQRVVVRHDRDRRPVYYRVVPRGWYYGSYGWSNGVEEYRPPARSVKCSAAGNCTVHYLDPRFDRRAYRVGYRDRYAGERRDDGHRGGDGRRRGGRDED